ncbi:positive regulator of sigma E activity [Arthrobacter sp. CAN_A212]|uniref:hypothetical protein n=1 Tax=Arthrobacter sp. CAN_A212 TaxID=2787719 RepID=UPI0018C939CB
MDHDDHTITYQAGDPVIETEGNSSVSACLIRFACGSLLPRARRLMQPANKLIGGMLWAVVLATE